MQIPHCLRWGQTWPVTTLLLTALMGALLGARANEELVGQSHFAKRDGQRIHLWRKVASDWKSKPAAERRAVVFVHGATWSGRPDFDLDVRDYSVMEHFARHGWDTYALDVQGYGASDDPVGANWSEAKDAALDLAAGVELIRELSGVEAVHLVGWSWGCQIAGLYAEAHPERVAKLVLQGGWFVLDFDAPAPTEKFRTNDARAAASDFIEGCFETDVVERYVELCLEHDATSPNGIYRDFLLTHGPLLTPEQLAMPVLLILGEHESDPKRIMDQASFMSRLASHHRRLLVLPGGGHAILLEKPHVRWQNEVRRFLEQDWE